MEINKQMQSKNNKILISESPPDGGTCSRDVLKEMNTVSTKADSCRELSASGFEMEQPGRKRRRVVQSEMEKTHIRFEGESRAVCWEFRLVCESVEGLVGNWP